MAAAMLLTGCGRDDVRVYHVPKEVAAHEHTHSTHSAQTAAPSRVPTVEWETPPGWEQVSPGQMRFASFRVTGEDGKTADLGVFPLPGMGMGDLENVNRWRGQVGQPPITEAERVQQAIDVEVQGLKAQVYEMAGENAGSGEKTRIVGAILKRDGIPWYFKMTGDDELVASQKEVFVGFLRSLRFGTSGPAELPPDHPPIGGATTASQASETSEKPGWQVPTGWQEVPAGQFLVAKFTLVGDNAQASVNVSNSSGDGGGLISNVNRWRRQVGLDELTAGEVSQMVHQLECINGIGSMVDMTGKGMSNGQPERVIGVVIPLGGKTWFYKLSGSEALVGKERQNFLNFVKTAKHPHA
jgi:hypothetical protein